MDEVEVAMMDKNMMQVLNEKSREVSQLKAEVGHLVENLNRERDDKEKERQKKKSRTNNNFGQMDESREDKIEGK